MNLFTKTLIGLLLLLSYSSLSYGQINDRDSTWWTGWDQRYMDGEMQAERFLPLGYKYGHVTRDKYGLSNLDSSLQSEDNNFLVGFSFFRPEGIVKKSKIYSEEDQYMGFAESEMKKFLGDAYISLEKCPIT